MSAMERRAAWSGPVPRSGIELRPDPGRPGAWTLLVDGVAQSYVDSADPTRLEFEYIRKLAWLADTIAPAGRPVDVLHLGGGACTMPRYVAATRPGSRQLVVEHDPAVADLVTGALPLPAGVELRLGDARRLLETLPDAAYDLLLSDVYQAAQMPRSVASAEFAAQARRVLRADGVYGGNVADLPPLAFTRRQVATLAAEFGEVCVLADPGMLRGRRYGNVVLAATPRAARLPLDRLVRLAARDPFPSRVVAGADLAGFVAGAHPVGDPDAVDSPAPPPSLIV
jgi:hypothetical protein